jgi:hypothetical protein
MRASALCLACLGAGAALGDAMHVVVGPRGTVVSVERPVTVSVRDAEIVLDHVPAEADLGSLTVRSRAPLGSMEWERVTPSSVERVGPVVDGADVRWVSSPAAAVEFIEGGEVRCRLRFSDAGSRVLNWTYATTGLSWRASYQVLVRGEFDHEDEPLSVDVEGIVVVSNGTSQTLGPCSLSVAGVGGGGDGGDGTPGFLLFGTYDSPLLGLMEEGSSARPMGHFYRLPGDVTLLPRREQGFTLFSVRRRPVERFYRLGIEGGTESAQPMRKFILFRNRTQEGPGPDLPAGRALIFLGSLRSALNQEARFEHTPASGEIFIDLGPSDRLRGFRSTTVRTAPEGGSYQETSEIRISSELKGTAEIEIEERPVSTLEWEVLRANRPWERRGQNLLFRTTAQGRGETVITYTLRINQPEG